MASTPTPGQDSPGTLTSIVETAFKFAGAIAVFGYLSLRAQLNFLGIPMTRSLGTERYLMEAGNAIHYVATFGVFILLGALVIGIGAWSLSRLLLWPLRRWGLVSSSGHRLPYFLGTRWYPLLLLTTFILFWLWAFDQIVQLTKEFVIVDPKTVPVRPRILFYLLLTICCAGYAACRWRPRTVRAKGHAGADLITRALWSMTIFVVVSVALLIPTTFGCCVRPAEYYTVELRVEPNPSEKTTDTMCGLLVFETDANLFVWRVVGAATGSVEVIQRAQIRQMKVGPSKDLRGMIQEIKEKKTVELCPKAGGHL